MIRHTTHGRNAFLEPTGVDKRITGTYRVAATNDPMPKPLPLARAQRGPPPAVRKVGLNAHHSANDPSSCRQTGLRQACPAASARRTAASSIVTPRPGASLRAMCPSTIRSGAGSAT